MKASILHIETFSSPPPQDCQNTNSQTYTFQAGDKKSEDTDQPTKNAWRYWDDPPGMTMFNATHPLAWHTLEQCDLSQKQVAHAKRTHLRDLNGGIPYRWVGRLKGTKKEWWAAQRSAWVERPERARGENGITRVQSELELCKRGCSSHNDRTVLNQGQFSPMDVSNVWKHFWLRHCGRWIATGI